MTFSQAFRYEITVGESTSFAELAAFVDRARAAGASGDTPVRAVSSPQDDEIVDHLLVELDSSASPANRTVPAALTVVQQLRDLLREARDSDGDVRTLMSAIGDAQDALADLADGEDIGDGITWTS